MEFSYVKLKAIHQTKFCLNKTWRGDYIMLFEYLKRVTGKISWAYYVALSVLTYLLGSSVERVSRPNRFAELQLAGIESATLVIGPSNYNTELHP